MSCNSFSIYTASTDTNLCSGGTLVNVYGDNTTLPLPGGIEFYSDSLCSTQIIDTFYFEYNDYIYYYYNGGTDSDPVPCPCPQNCAECGPSYSAYSEDQCYSLDIIASTPPVTTLPLFKSDGNTSYSFRGSFVYDPGYSVSGYTDFSGGDFVNLPSVPLWVNTTIANTIKGPLNRCGIWVCASGSCLPTDVWLGFSQCIDINETKTYYIGIGGDNEFKLVLDGVTIVNTRLSNAYWYGLGQNRPFQRWNIYPITVNSGSHIIELYGWNSGGPGTMGCEIYDNTLSELSAATLYSELNVLFTSSGQSEVTIVQDGSDEYISSGYTCPSGYVYNACDNTCVKYEFCDICTPGYYCIINTENYNGTYVQSGTYGSYAYYSGSSGYIFYSTTETRWCLSSFLGDPCDQFGPYGSTSITPDLDDTVMYEGECVTTTTTTNPCVDFDFTALFDCLVPVSPSPTPTNTPTPTPTPTPSPSDPCGGRDMIVGASGYTPTPTPTMTPTPSPSPEITRPCNFSGEAIFNAFTEILQCANSKRFTDCFTGIDYYTSDLVLTPFNTSPKEGYVYNAVINGQGVCVVFQGLFENISGVDKVVLTDEVGSAVDGSCLSCLPNLSATPTPTPTQTPTPTPSPSPCVSYEYRVKNISPLPIRIFFLSCSGSRTITLESEKVTIVCSKTLPTASSSNVEITALNTLCI